MKPVKIISLREDEIRDIGDAFADFEYEESEFGMATWGFGIIEIPKKGDILDIGCGGGYNIKMMNSI